MLERASAYIEKGRIQIQRCTKNKIKSRRMLHSGFWQHGGDAISLPSWWSSLLPSLPSESLDSSQHSCYNSTSLYTSWLSREPILDFLYPNQALDLLNRLNLQELKSLKSLKGKKRRFPDCSSQRDFSSAAVSVPTEKLELAAILEPVTSCDTSAKRVATLRAVIQRGEAEHEYAWQIFGSLHASERGRIAPELLRYMSNYDDIADAERYLHIFRSLEGDKVGEQEYRHAIRASILSGDNDKALQIHRRALDRKIDGDFGSSMLFAHLARSNQWNLVVSLYRSFVRYIRKNTKISEVKEERENETHLEAEKLTAIKSLWGSLSDKDELNGLSQSFVSFIESETKPETSYRKFCNIVLLHFVDYTITLDSSERMMQFGEFLQRLDRIEFATGRAYATLVERLLRRTPERNRFNTDSGPVRKIWIQWRENKSQFMPSRYILYRFLRQACWDRRSTGPASMESIVADWRDLHHTLTIKALLKLMQTYAMMGDTEKVYKYFEEFKIQNDGRITYEPLKRLALLHGQRGEAQQCVELFRRMRSEYNLEPVKYFWNMMLLACAKNDDLAGCYRVVDEIERNGMRPDAVTYGPMMFLLAKRGDISAVRQLLHLAHEKNLLISTQLISAVVLAYINNDDYKTAEKVVIEATELKLKRPEKICGFLTTMWNYLLTAYASRQNVRAILRLFQLMRTNKVDPDQKTYAALMRCISTREHTTHADKIFRRFVPLSSSQSASLNWAVLMNGYINRREYRRAIELNEMMKRRGIKDTTSTRLALIKATTLLEAERAKQTIQQQAGVEFTDAESIIDDTISGNEPYDALTVEPGMGLQFEKSLQLHPSVFASYLMNKYGKVRSLRFAKVLFDKYIRTEDKPITGRAAGSYRLLTTLLGMYRRDKAWKELDECWDLAKSQAEQLATVRKAELPYGSVDELLRPDQDGDGNDVQQDRRGTSEKFALPSIADNAPDRSLRDIETEIPLEIVSNRRLLISRAFSEYFRGLCRQRRYVNAMETLSEVMKRGYSLDMQAWNTVVQLLAHGGYLETACAICERVLMPNWPGWRPGYGIPPSHKGLIEKPIWYSRRGNTAKGLIHLNTRWRGSSVLMPYYHTIVYLYKQFMLMEEKQLPKEAHDENEKHGNDHENTRLFADDSVVKAEPTGKYEPNTNSSQANIDDCHSDSDGIGSHFAGNDENYGDRSIDQHDLNSATSSLPDNTDPDAELDDSYSFSEVDKDGDASRQQDYTSNASLAEIDPAAAASAIASCHEIGPEMCKYFLPSLASQVPTTYERIYNFAPTTISVVEQLPPIPDKIQVQYLRRFGPPKRSGSAEHANGTAYDDGSEKA